MKKTIKKIVSLFMVIVLMFTMSQSVFAVEARKVVGADEKTELNIETDKKKYSWGDTITFNITVKNVSGEHLDYVNVKVTPRNFSKFLPNGNSTVTVYDLEAGESETIQIKFDATRLMGGLMRLLVPFLMLFSDFAMKTLYRETAFNYQEKVKVGGIRYKFGFEVTYDKPIENEHVVSFDLNYVGADSENYTQTVVDGETVVEPEEPNRENYIFDGWYTEADGDNLFDFSSIINSDLTLYAHWFESSLSDTTHSVTFLLNDGSDGAYEMQSVIANRRAITPTNPEKEQFIFTGWYTEPSTLNKFNFNTRINENIFLYAGWKAAGASGDDTAVSSSSGGGTIFSITGIKIENNATNVTINVNEMSALVVRFFNEETGEIIGTISTQTPNYCEMSYISIPITFDLPEYFKVTADLYDSNSEKRCNTYVCIDYTSVYAEFAEQTIYDFPGKTVINFDTAIDNNFGVLSDDVILLDQSENENILTVSYSEDENDDKIFYTFTYANEDVSNLSIGDIVLARDIDSNVCLFKIGDINKENNSYVFTASTGESELTEFYEVLKVDLKSSEENAVAETKLNTSTQRTSKARGGIEVININGDPVTAAFNPTLEWKINDNISVSGGLNFSVTVDIKASYDVHIFGKDYFSMSLTSVLEGSGNAKIEVSGDNDPDDKYMTEKLNKEFKFPKLRIPTPITGLHIVVETGVPFSLSAQGSVEFSLTFKNENGFSYDTNSGRQDIDKKERTVEVKAEGEIEVKFGPKVTVAVEFLGTVLSASIEAWAGVKGTATATWQIANDTTAESKHACTLCVSAEAKWFCEASIKLEYYIAKKVLEGEIFNFKVLDLEGQILFNNFTTVYWSLIHSEDNVFGSGTRAFGFGECPNKSYRTTIKLLDDNGTEIEGSNVTVKKENSSIEYTDSSTFVKYLYDGTYTVKTKINDTDITKRFVVSGSAQVIELKQTSGDGKINGKIIAAEDNSAVSEANIIIYKDNLAVASLKSGSDGNYSVSLPDGVYLVKITKDSYIPFEQYVTVKDATESYLETSLLVAGNSNKHGGFSGTIRNAVNNNVEKNVNLTVRKGWDNYNYGDVVLTLKTDANGFYEKDITNVFGVIFGIESGYYTVKASKIGYVDKYFNIIVKPGIVNTNQDAVISPITTGNYRIVLTWGATPSDLDSHLIGTTASGSYEHIYYSNKTGYTGNLDVDDTSSYGPETITVTSFDKLESGFTYSVHDYTNKSSSSNRALSNSGATVSLYQGSVLLETYHVPTDKTGTVWRVFSIDKNGDVKNLNEFYNQSIPSQVT